MRITRNLLTLFFCLALFITSISGTIEAFAASPKVPNTFYVAVGGTLTIPTDLSGCSGTSKKWSGGNSYFSITSNGSVTGKSQGSGSAICTTNKGEVATCTVTVVPAANLSINRTSATLNAGESLKLNVSISPNKAIKKVTWSSSDSSIASVDGNGNVKAKNRSGNCTITCTSEDGTNKKVSCSVSVKVPTTSPPTTKPPTTRQHTTTKPSSSSSSGNSGNHSSGNSSGGNSGNSGNGYTRGREIPTESNTEYQGNGSGDTGVSTSEETTTVSYTRGEEITEPQKETTTYNNDITFEKVSSTEKQEDSAYALKAVSQKKQPIIIEWNKIENADGYVLLCFEPDSDKFEVIYDGTDTKYEKHLFENGKKYVFKVKYYKIVNNKKQFGTESEMIGIKAVNKSIFQLIFEKFS